MCRGRGGSAREVPPCTSPSLPMDSRAQIATHGTFPVALLSRQRQPSTPAAAAPRPAAFLRPYGNKRCTATYQHSKYTHAAAKLGDSASLCASQPRQAVGGCTCRFVLFAEQGAEGGGWRGDGDRSRGCSGGTCLACGVASRTILAGGARVVPIPVIGTLRSFPCVLGIPPPPEFQCHGIFVAAVDRRGVAGACLMRVRRRTADGEDGRPI